MSSYRIDSSGRVGINTNTPGSFDAGADNLVVGSGSGDNGITIYSGTSNLANLYFADGTSGSAVYSGGMNYNHSTDQMALFTNGGQTRMSIDSSGRVLVGATSGTGKFIVQDSSLPKIQSNFNGTKHLEMGVGGSGGGFAMTTGHFLTINHQPYADRGTDNNLTERFRIGPSGQIGLGGANYGTSSQVLTSNGSGSAPTWQDAAGGAWNLLSTVNASGASTVNLTGIDNTYAAYVIKMTNATIVPGASGRHIYCQFLISNSVSASSGFYANRREYLVNYDMDDDLSGSVSYQGQHASIGLKAPGNNFFTKYVGATFCEVTNEIGNATNKSSMEMVLMHPGVSYGNHAFWWHVMTMEPGTSSSRTKFRHSEGHGLHYVDTSDPNDTSGSAISGVRFTVNRNTNSAGTITGKFQLYGIS